MLILLDKLRALEYIVENYMFHVACLSESIHLKLQLMKAFYKKRIKEVYDRFYHSRGKTYKVHFLNYNLYTLIMIDFKAVSRNESLEITSIV